MSNILFYNIILFECMLVLVIYLWQDEISYWYYIGIIYVYISYVSIMWLLCFGHKYFKLTYRKPDDEPGVYRVIEFPSVWW